MPRSEKEAKAVAAAEAMLAAITAALAATPPDWKRAYRMADDLRHLASANLPSFTDRLGFPPA